MSIKVTWTSMRSTPDTLTLYWSNTPFTPDTLPSNVVELSPTATDYTDTTVPANTVRYYMVKASKAGLPNLYSQCLVYGNYAKTGPGANTIMRGDWNVGLMDILTPDKVFTIAGLKAALGLAGSFGGSPAESTLTNWFKFMWRGKILLIPSAPMSNVGVLQWSQLYNAGLIYGVDGPGAAPFDLVSGGLSPAVPAQVNQKRVVNIGYDNFLVRAPRLSTLATDQIVPPDQSTFVGGEWWETMCRMTQNIFASNVDMMPAEKWWDNKGTQPYTCTATPHFLANKINCAMHSTTWSAYTGRNVTGAVGGNWVNWTPVLEYIGPADPKTPGVYSDGVWDANGKFHKRAIPIFYANTTEGYVASASSQYDSNYLPWKAFDYNPQSSDSSSVWLASNATLPQWLAITLPAAKRLTGLALRAYTTPTVGGGVVNFTVETSNDGSTWNAVFTSPTRAKNKTDYDIYTDVFDVTTRYIRIKVTAVEGASYYASIFDALFLEPYS